MDEFEEMLRLNALEEEIIKRYEAGERNFAGTDLRNIRISYPCFLDTDFSDTNLECSSICGTDFINANFIGANLEWSYLPNLLINSNLSKTNLRGAKWRGATFVNVDMTGADLTGADLTSSISKTTKLIGCDLRNANLTDIKIDESVVFASTIMPDGSIRNDPTRQIVDVQQLREHINKGGNFQDIVIHNADFSGIDLRGVKMSGAYFSNVSFRDADLFRADFNRSSFICCDFRGANFGANLEGARLINLDLKETYLSSTSLYHAMCIRVDFQGTRANFLGAEVSCIETIMPNGECISMNL